MITSAQLSRAQILRYGLSKHSLRVCELILFLALLLSHCKYMDSCKYGDMENTVTHAFFCTSDSQGHVSVSVHGRFIALGKKP